jgi:hypothetical protein
LMSSQSIKGIAPTASGINMIGELSVGAMM